LTSISKTISSSPTTVSTSLPPDLPDSSAANMPTSSLFPQPSPGSGGNATGAANGLTGLTSAATAPGSLHAATSSLSLNGLESSAGGQEGNGSESRTMQLALELALLQQGGNTGYDVSPPSGSLHHHSHASSDNPLLHPFGQSSSPASNCLSGSLEDLKTRRSQNMTECVPVPTSEHVAEIVGRQGKKRKFFPKLCNRKRFSKDIVRLE